MMILAEEFCSRGYGGIDWNRVGDGAGTKHAFFDPRRFSLIFIPFGSILSTENEKELME